MGRLDSSQTLVSDWLLCATVESCDCGEFSLADRLFKTVDYLRRASSLDEIYANGTQIHS